MSVMGCFGVIAVDEFFGKCSDFGFKVGKWSGSLLLF